MDPHFEIVTSGSDDAIRDDPRRDLRAFPTPLGAFALVVLLLLLAGEIPVRASRLETRIRGVLADVGGARVTLALLRLI